MSLIPKMNFQQMMDFYFSDIRRLHYNDKSGVDGRKIPLPSKAATKGHCKFCGKYVGTGRYMHEKSCASRPKKDAPHVETKQELPPADGE